MRSLNSIERAAACAGFAALALWFLFFLELPWVNHDVFHAMALARDTLSLGRVPLRDLYSYAETRSPVVHHEWLAGMFALGAWRAAGVHGFNFLWLAVVLGYAAVCARALSRLRPVTALCAGFLAFPLIAYSLFQPLLAQAYSVLLCGILLLLLARDASAQRAWMPAAVPLFVLWTNLHAGVVIGFGVLAAYTAERRVRGEPWRRLAALLAVLLAAVAVNPYGWDYYAYLARALTMPRPHIAQWRPGWFLEAGELRYSIPMAALLAVYGYAVAASGARFRGALVTALLAAGSLRAHKILPFFALAWLFYVPAALSGTRFGEAVERAGRRALRYAGPAFVAAAALLSLAVVKHRPWPVAIPSHPEAGFILPVGPADYLERTAFRGNVMTFFRHGAYLSWRLHPRVKVSCDARYEAAYPDGHAERNLDLYLKQPRMLAGELRRLPRTDLILTDRRFPLAAELARLPGWFLAYSDTGFLLYARDGAELPRLSGSTLPRGPQMFFVK